MKKDELRVLKLGTVLTDKATKMEGTLTHLIVGMDRKAEYLLQPRRLNDEGQPVLKLFIPEERMNGYKESDFHSLEVPFEILGSQVTDKASGFSGMAVRLVYHINGCFHAEIQPEGVNAKTGSCVETRDFDLRGCEGEKIPTFATPEDVEKSQKVRPSPTGDKIPSGAPRIL